VLEITVNTNFSSGGKPFKYIIQGISIDRNTICSVKPISVLVLEFFWLRCPLLQ